MPVSIAIIAVVLSFVGALIKQAVTIRQLKSRNAALATENKQLSDENRDLSHLIVSENR